MAIPHARPGQLMDVRPLGPQLANQRTTTLVKTDKLELVRLVLPRGKQIAEHRAPGPITVQCLEGKVAFTTLGNTHVLEAGSLLHLDAGQPHALLSETDASLLLTLLLPAG